MRRTLNDTDAIRAANKTGSLWCERVTIGDAFFVVVFFYCLGVMCGMAVWWAL